MEQLLKINNDVDKQNDDLVEENKQLKESNLKLWDENQKLKNELEKLRKALAIFVNTSTTTDDSNGSGLKTNPPHGTS